MSGAPQVVARWGTAARLLPGWDARLGRRVPSAVAEIAHPVLHLANFRLPGGMRGDYGSSVVARMHRQDVFVALKEFHPGSAHSALFRHPVPWPFVPRDADPRGLQRTIAGQSGVQRFFSWNGRAWCVYVVLGSHPHRAPLLAKANDALDGVEVARWQPHYAARYVSD